MGIFILLLSLISLCYVSFCITKLILKRRGQSCYMLAYECYKPPEDTKLDSDSCANIILRNRNLGLEEYRFLLKSITKSGIGENTYAPRNIIEGREASCTVEESLKEMDEIMFNTLDNLFNNSTIGFISPSQIDILVVSVCTFASVPSLTSRIINRYKLRENIMAFNLGGMGCSGSAIAVGLVQQLFRTHKNSYAVVVSSECLSPSWYCGKDKSMMLPNCLFRSGGCAMLFTNMSSQQHIAMLRLKHVERTHLGASDEAYGCATLVEDEQGYKGFRLSRSLPNSAAKALEVNLRKLVPKVFPLWKLVWVFTVSLCQCMMKEVTIFGHPNISNTLLTLFICLCLSLLVTLKTYYIYYFSLLFLFLSGCKLAYRCSRIIFLTKEARVSNVLGTRGMNLKSGIEHFCVHPGGKAVIDGIGKGLGLNDYDLEPSRMTIHRWGNTSASGVWYVLGYMEAKKRLKKGDRILMIGLGSGFKCCNCVWEVMRDLEGGNAWKDCIDCYPPNTLTNLFEKKYGWLSDEALNFVRESELKAIAANKRSLRRNI